MCLDENSADDEVLFRWMKSVGRTSTFEKQCEVLTWPVEEDKIESFKKFPGIPGGTVSTVTVNQEDTDSPDKLTCKGYA